MKPFHVYLLRCADGSYYCGHTDELEARLRLHEDGDTGYTSTRKPVELVWQGEFETREGALEFEQRVKGWSRAKKEALIRDDWDEVSRLSRPASRTHSHAESVRPELVEGSASRKTEASTGSARTDAGIGTDSVRKRPATTVRPELAEGSASRKTEASTGSARTDGGIGTDSVRKRLATTVRPELVEGSASRKAEASTSSARTDVGVSTDSVRKRLATTVRPELVEGSASHKTAASTNSARTDGASAILAGNRRALAKAITLLESTRPDHREQADELLQALMPHTGGATRLGISGVPGVGKSTFIETLGLHLIDEHNHRVAVLAIDPSSSLSGGSILGDKTRMERLSVHDRAFIRPSPASGTLGGVAEKTRETMLLCEAAGYEVVIVETVGVGQSETAVAGMTDLFVLMQLPNAGDDLQAIKRGVMELADMVVINKADLDAAAATRAQAQITSALRIFGHHGNPQHREAAAVMQLSALEGHGVPAFWQAVTTTIDARRSDGSFDARRRDQAQAWMWDVIRSRLFTDFREHAAVRAALDATSAEVAAGTLAPSVAARRLLQAFERT